MIFISNTQTEHLPFIFENESTGDTVMSEENSLTYLFLSLIPYFLTSIESMILSSS